MTNETDVGIHEKRIDDLYKKHDTLSGDVRSLAKTMGEMQAVQSKSDGKLDMLMSTMTDMKSVIAGESGVRGKHLASIITIFIVIAGLSGSLVKNSLESSDKLGKANDIALQERIDGIDNLTTERARWIEKLQDISRVAFSTHNANGHPHSVIAQVTGIEKLIGQLTDELSEIRRTSIETANTRWTRQDELASEKLKADRQRNAIEADGNVKGVN